MKTLAELERALWPDLSRSSRPGAIALETLSAVSLLDLTESRTLERASAVLLERALRQGPAAGACLDQPFFRLAPEERFLLAALHLGRWSYGRCARVMGETPEAVEIAAWKARVSLGTSVGIHPIGGKLATRNCPEYRLDRPWTQRFLDEEIRAGNELLFLQNHMMACDSCRQALIRCRDLYFAVEKMLPRVADQDATVQALTNAWGQSQVILRKKKVTFGESLASFFRQWDVQAVLAFALFCLFVAYFRHHG